MAKRPRPKQPRIQAPVVLPTVRCTFSIPGAMFRDITSTAVALGISRSALIVSVAGDAVREMARDVEELEASQDKPTTARRLRGKSVAFIEQVYREFVDEMSGETLQ